MYCAESVLVCIVLLVISGLLTVGSESTDQDGTEFKHFKRIIRRYRRLSSDGCVSEITENAGSIESPGWPVHYHNNQDCWTRIQVQQRQHIFWTFQEMFIESNYKCSFDYVEVIDGPTKTDRVLGRFCRMNETRQLKSTSNSLLIHFHSDGLFYKKGYKANFNIVGFPKTAKEVGDCRWVQNANSVNGKISSPGKKYPSNAFCRIQIEAPEDHYIKIIFTKLKLEYDDQCSFDWVELRDGDQEGGSLLARVCGTNSTISKPETTTNKLMVTFRSDDFLEFEGFELKYTYQKNIKEVTETTATPNRHTAFPNLSDATVEQGLQHVLSCDSKHSSSNITWLKENKEIDSQWIPKGLTFENNNRLLKIEAMSPASVGIYRCFADQAGPAVATAWIGIISNSTDCPIEFQNVPSNVKLAKNDFKLLQCSSTAACGVEFTWEKNGYLLSPSQRIQWLSSGSLVINEALHGDEGVYTCVATSLENNCVKRVSAKVEVVEDYEQVCGIPKVQINSEPLGKIVRGNEAIRGRHPWQAMFWSLSQNAFCGGALLNKRWLMTAAHCFDKEKEEVLIRLGKNDESKSEPGEFNTTIELLIIHPDYSAAIDPGEKNQKSYNNDIALVMLKNPVTFTDYILPVCLGEARLLEDTFFKGIQMQSGKVAGWGKTAQNAYSKPKHLQEVELRMVEWSKCQASASTKAEVTRNMFCAGTGLQGGEDSCQGDSGGPFVVEIASRHYAVGIVSWGEGCANKGKYGFYTKVSNYHDWIKSIIQI